MNPYERLPKLKLRIRVWLLSAAIGVVAFLLLGVGVAFELFPSAAKTQPRSVYSSQAVGQVEAAARSPGSASIRELMPWTLATHHIERTLNFWLHLPESCFAGMAPSDFQKAQCEVFWSELREASIYGFAPFAIFFAAIWFLSRRAFDEYRRLRRAVRVGRPAFVGKVNSGPLKKRGFWAWFHCLQVFKMTHPDNGPSLVYWPEDLPIPSRGTELAAYSIGERAGSRRYVAKVHQPHVALVKGNRYR